jgi:hypothetical protein
MSYVPAPSNRDMYVVVAIAVVAVIAMFMRRSSRDSGSAGEAASPGPLAEAGTEPSTHVSEDLSWEDSDDDDEAAGVVAVTSDGWAFMPDGDEVQLVPLASAEGGEETDPTDAINATAMLPHPRHRHLPIAKPGEHLDAGDFIGARVVRGSPGSDPWRLEALGQYGEYRSWAFETEEAARGALDLLVTRIVRAQVDDDGVPRLPADAAYAAAAALTEAGVADLAMDTGDETPETFTR